MKNNCDCFIGFINGSHATKSSIAKELVNASNLMYLFKENNFIKGNVLTPKQIADNRRGYLFRFAYCPYCGEKINWKQLLIGL